MLIGFNVARMEFVYILEKASAENSQSTKAPQ